MPHCSEEVAKKYVESLPIGIRPIRGTDGEAHRLQLYNKQIDHDLSPKARQSNLEVDRKLYVFFEQKRRTLDKESA